jgi:hypothetical protein
VFHWGWTISVSLEGPRGGGGFDTTLTRRIWDMPRVNWDLRLIARDESVSEEI